jgi:hypothetical protein
MIGINIHIRRVEGRRSLPYQGEGDKGDRVTNKNLKGVRLIKP